MSLKHSIVRLLDRPGGRTTLATLSTFYVRRHIGGDIAFAYKRGWTHRMGRYIYPGSDSFDYDLGSITRLRSRHKEHEDFWFPFYRPPRGSVVIDVGAGQGEDLPAMLDAVGESGKIVAIEAHPRSFHELERFSRLNRLENVLRLNIAVAEKPAVMTLTDLDDWESNEIAHVSDRKAKVVSVRAETLDDICEVNGIHQVDFIKINIEGAERTALLGMTRVIERCQAICVACHDFRADRGDGERFRTRAFVGQFLATHGFSLFSRQDDPRDYVRDHIFGLR